MIFTRVRNLFFIFARSFTLVVWDNYAENCVFGCIVTLIDEFANFFPVKIFIDRAVTDIITTELKRNTGARTKRFAYTRSGGKDHRGGAPGASAILSFTHKKNKNKYAVRGVIPEYQ